MRQHRQHAADLGWANNQHDHQGHVVEITGELCTMALFVQASQTVEVIKFRHAGLRNKRNLTITQITIEQFIRPMAFATNRS